MNILHIAPGHNVPQKTQTRAKCPWHSLRFMQNSDICTFITFIYIYAAGDYELYKVALRYADKLESDSD